MLSKYVFKLKSQNKATFNPVQYCNPAEGGLYSGGLITGCIFLFPVRWAYNWGAYNQNFTVVAYTCTCKL